MILDKTTFMKSKNIFFGIILTAVLMIFLFYGGDVMALQIQSSAFSNEGTIPAKYTCDGENISPPLSWGQAPQGTKSFALIMDDPDAPHGTFDHWLVFNLPADTHTLPEAIKTLPVGTQEGKNSFGKTSYGGPCPPDREHRYFFKLYALDQMLPLKNGASKREIELAMKDHVLQLGQVMGRYDRSRK